MTPDVALVSCAPTPTVDTEHGPIIAALERRGVYATTVAWDDARFQWSGVKAAVIRSTWDYHHRRNQFVAWAEAAGAQTALWNPPAVVRWNTHKGYLRELESRGFPVVPTVWLAAGSAVPDLAALMSARGWAELVVKPAVSGGAHKTLRVEPLTAHQGEALLGEILAGGDAMVQPYLRSVETRGERALVWIDGEWTHTVRKTAVLTEGPEQSSRAEPAPDELELARALVAEYAPRLLYARVDIVRDQDDTPRLIELELVEPYLFLHHHPPAVERLADAILRRIR